MLSKNRIALFQLERGISDVPDSEREEQKGRNSRKRAERLGFRYEGDARSFPVSFPPFFSKGTPVFFRFYNDATVSCSRPLDDVIFMPSPGNEYFFPIATSSLVTDPCQSTTVPKTSNTSASISSNGAISNS